MLYFLQRDLQADVLLSKLLQLKLDHNELLRLRLKDLQGNETYSAEHTTPVQ